MQELFPLGFSYRGSLRCRYSRKERVPGRKQEQRTIFPSIFTANLRGKNSDEGKFIYTLQRILNPSSFTSADGGTGSPKPTSQPRSKHPMTSTLPMYSQKNPAHSQLFVAACTRVGTYSRGASKTCLTEKRPDGCQINSAPLLFPELTHYTWKAGCLSG